MIVFGVRIAKLCRIAHALDEILIAIGPTNGTSLVEPQPIHVNSLSGVQCLSTNDCRALL